MLTYLTRGDFTALFRHTSWPQDNPKSFNFTFRIEGETGLVSDHAAVQEAIITSRTAGLLAVCLVTGQADVPERKHPSIKGIAGGKTTGVSLVSFNLPAFVSHGWEQGDNAPVGKRAAAAYTTALNHLLAYNSRQKLVVGGSTIVFWAEVAHPIEGDFAALFGFTPGLTEQDTAQIRSLYLAPLTGANPPQPDDTLFRVLEVSPNSARLVVRYWYETTVNSVVRAIREHFADCCIVHAPWEQAHLNLRRLLDATAPPRKPGDTAPTFPDTMVTELLQAILERTPYPLTLLAGAVERARVERDVSYARAAIIKACLSRQARFYHHNDEEVTMALDKTNKDTAYRLGRLFALVERVQTSAIPGISAGVRDRYFGAAATKPGLVFPQLMDLNMHHLSKLSDSGLAVVMDREIGSVMEEITEFPNHLDLAQQGRFIIGYYHQRQDFFKNKSAVKI